MQVSGATPECVDVKRQAVAATLDQGRGAALAVGAAQSQLGCTGGRRQGCFGNAVVDGVDHTADRTAAIHQRRRATQYLDALDHQGVDRHGVVEAQARCVECSAGVAQHPNAVAVQAANHRAIGVRAEVGGRHARQAVERIAQRAAAPQHQARAGQHRCRCGDIGVAQWVAGDEHRRLCGLRPGRSERDQQGRKVSVFHAKHLAGLSVCERAGCKGMGFSGVAAVASGPAQQGCGAATPTTKVQVNARAGGGPRAR